MKDPGQFGSSKPPAEGAAPGTLDCAAVEQWLAESAENSLPAETMEKLRTHAAGCASCQEKLAQTRRGREWLLVLKQESLEPPADMVARILARTSMAGAPGTADSVAPVSDQRAATSSTRSGFENARNLRAKDVLPVYAGGVVAPVYADRQRLESTPADFRPGHGAGRSLSSAPAWQRNTVVVLRRTLVEPRLAMVAAMAFFSITLTLNLMGVRLTNMHPADLAPSNMRRAASRQYAEVNARVARYYENLRIVYEVEARVQRLRRAAETSPAPSQGSGPRKRSSNANGEASGDQTESHRVGMVRRRAVRLPSLPDPNPVVTGPRIDAAFHPPFGAVRSTAVPTANMASVVPPETPFAFSPARLASSRPLCLLWFSRRFLSTPERGFA